MYSKTTMNQKKYITVNINLPLEINPDGTYIIMQDHLQMDFIKCENRPLPPSEKKDDFSYKLQNTIKGMMANILTEPVYNNDDNDYDDEDDNHIMILKHEMKHKPNRKSNTSFKHRKGKSHSFTSRNYG